MSSIRSPKLRENNIEEKRPCRTSCVLPDAWFREPHPRSRIQFKYFLFSWENYFFLKHYITPEGAVSHNILYYEQLSIACYQVNLYANNYFE